MANALSNPILIFFNERRRQGGSLPSNRPKISGCGHGADNQHVNEVLYQCADDWCSEFESNQGLDLEDDDREKAIEAYTAAFFDPNLADQKN